MLILKDSTYSAEQIRLDIQNNDQYAQVVINGNFDLEMYYNPTQPTVFAIYRDQPFEVTPHATLKQFLDTLLPHSDYEFQLDNCYITQFTSDPLGMTLADIRHEVGVFQFNITMT